MDRVEPVHSNVMVVRYTKPEEVGNLVLPGAFLGDRTQTLWEVRASGPCVCEACEYCDTDDYHGLGIELKLDDIVATEYGWSATPLPDSLGQDLWMLHAKDIVSVTRWKDDD